MVFSLRMTVLFGQKTQMPVPRRWTVVGSIQTENRSTKILTPTLRVAMESSHRTTNALALLIKVSWSISSKIKIGQSDQN
jgi:hypothetical protein